MIKKLLKHEIKLLMKSNRVLWSVMVFILLFAIVFWVRVGKFNEQNANYIADQMGYKDIQKAATNYSFLRTYAVYPPILFSVYHEGAFVNYGHLIDKNCFTLLEKSTSRNEKAERYFEAKGGMDITFLITFFLSLFVLLNTFDSINQEKQSGTLRLLMTFEIRRVDFLIQKIVGVFLFVSLVFIIPYLLSLLVLIVKYSSIITASFLYQWFIYLIYTLVFIFCFVLIGVWTSLLSKKPGRSLVYSIFCWLLLVIIVPVLYSGVIKYIHVGEAKDQQLYNEYNSSKDKYWNEKNTQKEIQNPFNGGHIIWNGGGDDFENTTIMSYIAVEKAHVAYIGRYYKNVLPIQRETEQKRLLWKVAVNNREKTQNYLFFFNPITQFQCISENISGCSYDEYLQFIKDGIALRDALIDQGIREKWLISRAYYAVVDTNAIIPDDYNLQTMQQVNDIFKKYPSKFKYPVLQEYQYKPVPLADMIKRTLLPLGFMLLFCLTFMSINIRLFNKYDVR